MGLVLRRRNSTEKKRHYDYYYYYYYYDSTGNPAGSTVKAVSQDVEAGQGPVISTADTSIISVGASYRAQRSGEADQRQTMLRKASSIYDRRAWGELDTSGIREGEDASPGALSARQRCQGLSPGWTRAARADREDHLEQSTSGARATTRLEKPNTDEASVIERERNVNLQSLAKISPFEGISSTPITSPSSDARCCGNAGFCRPCFATAGEGRRAASCCFPFSDASGGHARPHDTNRELRTCCRGRGRECRCKCRELVVCCCRVAGYLPGCTTSPSSDREGASNQGLLPARESGSGPTGLAVPSPGGELMQPPASLGPAAPGKTGFFIGTGEDSDLSDDVEARGKKSDGVSTEVVPVNLGGDTGGKRNGLTPARVETSQTVTDPTLQKAEIDAAAVASEEKGSTASCTEDSAGVNSSSFRLSYRPDLLRSGRGGTWTDEEIDKAGGNDFTVQPLRDNSDEPVFGMPQETEVIELQASESSSRNGFHIGPTIMRIIQGVCSSTESSPRKQAKEYGSQGPDWRQKPWIQRRSRQRFSMEDFDGSDMQMAWEEQRKEVERIRRAGGLSPGSDWLIERMLPVAMRERVHASRSSARSNIVCPSDEEATEGSSYLQRRENIQNSLEASDKAVTSPTSPFQHPASESGGGLNHKCRNGVLPDDGGPSAQHKQASDVRSAPAFSTRDHGSCSETPDVQSPSLIRRLRHISA